jgi:hypothetical protein
MNTPITTMTDVLDHFSADYEEGDSDELRNSRLSRRIYKATSCGAWAKVVLETQHERKDQEWTAEYVRTEDKGRIDGKWRVVSYRGPDDAAPRIVADPAYLYPITGTMPPPQDVIDYFWPDGVEMYTYLDERFPGQDKATVTETLTLRVPLGMRYVFRVGSIVEGTDSEWETSVVLPCLSDALDDAVQEVEAWAQEVWDDSHGCEGCAAKQDEDAVPIHCIDNVIAGERAAYDIGGPVHPKCPDCKGHGIAI